jgi:hypothetical protein
MFERFIAMTRERGNIGHLVDLADAFGYLGDVAVMVAKNLFHPGGNVLELFLLIGWVVGGLSLAALAFTFVFFSHQRPATGDVRPPS